MRTTRHIADLLLFVALLAPWSIAQGQPATPPSRATRTEAIQYVHEQWTVEDGLPVNNLNDLVQTRDGYLWIATWDGLVRFDGVRFTPFNVGNTARLPSSRTVELFEARDSTLWIITVAPNALVRFKNGRFRAYRSGSAVFPGTRSTWIRILGEDDDGRLWVRTKKASYYYQDDHLTRVDRARTPALGSGGADTPTAAPPWRIEERRRVYHNGQGVFTAPSRVMGAVADHEGSFWIATETDGLHRLKPSALTTFAAADGGARLNAYALEEDATGLWVGTRQGVLYRLQNEVLTPYAESASIFWLSRDRDGTLWIGGGGPSYNRQLQQLRGRTSMPVALPDGCEGAITGMHEDRRGARWFTVQSGGVLRLRGDTCAHFGDEAGFPKEAVHSIQETRDGAVWFLTNGGGLVRYRNGHFAPFTAADGLSGNNVRGFYEDEDGLLWVGTYGRGLNRIDLRGASELSEAHVTIYGTRDGLYDDVIHAILEDDVGRLWMSTNRGLFWVRRPDLNAFAEGRIDRVRSVFYDERDGMRNREANGGGHRPGLKDRQGRLWFPTQDGVVRIDPRRIRPSEVPPPAVIEQVAAGDTTLTPHGRDAIHLSATQRDFEIRYTGLSFLAPEQMRFRYRLEGYDPSWRAVSRRTAFYTKVPPGTYTFRMAAMNKDGIWSEKDAALTLTVAPFFYETTWFYVLSGLVVVLLGMAGYRARTRQHRRRQQELEVLVGERTEELRAEKARTEAQADKLRELDAAKSRFFANITHEFRTPLTLIIGPLRNALAGAYGQTPAPLQDAHRMMLRNSQRLLRLINQILDLARAEVGRLTLDVQQHDLADFTRKTVQAFMPLAERQRIHLTAEVAETPVAAVFDLAQLEKVLLNLLSNALKFTGAGSSVQVTLSAEGRDAVIAVRDTGIGIPAEKQRHLFDRFYQADVSDTRAHEGTGIGLALVKELVELHGGTIAVESTPGAGSTFTVRLPILNSRVGILDLEEDRSDASNADDPLAPVVGEAAQIAPVEEESAIENPKSAIDQTTVLVVDDNADVRTFVRSILEPAYRVLEAADGQAGLEHAKATLPDLIVSDVMMPEMDGFALSRALKDDPATDGIPLILLTARADTEGEREGLETGADDYVTKPFEAKVLRARVAGLIATRQRLRKRYRRESQPAEPAPPRRSAFEQRLREIVEARLTDPEFNPDALADEAALSYSQLYRRLHDERDESPSQFIRSVRVERAAQLLTEEVGTISEIAYAVGFNSLSYFNRSFREHFDCAPSAYICSDA